MSPEIKAEIVNQMIAILSPIITALLGWLSYRLAAWIKAKTKNEMVGGILLRLSDSVFTLVREAQQTAVNEIKSAAIDGKLTKAEAADIKSKVAINFKTLWGFRGLDEMQKILGLTSMQVNDLIDAKIEEAVHLEKTRDARRD